MFLRLRSKGSLQVNRHCLSQSLRHVSCLISTCIPHVIALSKRSMFRVFVSIKMVAISQGLIIVKSPCRVVVAAMAVMGRPSLLHPEQGSMWLYVLDLGSDRTKVGRTSLGLCQRMNCHRAPSRRANPLRMEKLISGATWRHCVKMVVQLPKAMAKEQPVCVVSASVTPYPFWCSEVRCMSLVLEYV